MPDPSRVIRVGNPLGSWGVLGAGEYRGFQPSRLNTESDEFGPSRATFDVTATGGIAIINRADILPFTLVEIEQSDVVIFAGRVARASSAGGVFSVQCDAYQAHADDDPFDKVFVHADLTQWVDQRSLLSANLTNFNASGTVTTGGQLGIGWAKDAQVAAGSWVGVTLDLGPDNLAASASIAFAIAGNAGGACTIYCRTHNDPSAAVTVGELTGFSGNFLTAYAGGYGSAAGTFSAPGRYVSFFLYSAGAQTFTADVGVALQTALIFTSDAYRSSYSSGLTGDVLARAALARCPLLSQDTSLITTGAQAIPSYQTGGAVAPRQVLQAAAVWDDYQVKIGGERQNQLVMRAKPAAPLYEVGAWPGSEFDDAGLDGSDVVNKVVLEAQAGDGSLLRVYRTAASLGNLPSGIIVPNGDVEAGTTGGWATSSRPGSFLAVSTPADTGSYAMFYYTGSDPYVGFYTPNTSGLTPGRPYRMTIRIYQNASTTAAGVIGWIRVVNGTTNAELGRAQLLGPLSASYTTYGVDFVADATGTALLNVEWTLASGVNAYACGMDNVTLWTGPVTLIDRLGFAKSKVLQVSNVATEAILKVLGDIYLRNHLTSNFQGKLTVTPGGVRRVVGGRPVHPSLLLREVGERVRFQNRTDPDTGADGRDGIIAGVAYDDDTETAVVEINSRSSAFQNLLQRFGALS